jgi:hypothetical protein
MSADRITVTSEVLRWAWASAGLSVDLAALKNTQG